MPNAKRVATPKQNDSASAPAPKPARKAHRPRIDSIVNAIIKGEYDDKLIELTKAILARNEARKEAVMALVHEVYGNEAQIVDPSKGESVNFEGVGVRFESRGTPPPRSNPFKEKAAQATPESESFDEPEVPSITSASGSVEIVRGPDDTDLDDDGGGGSVTVTSTGGGEIISNSPTIS
jgi:hypothetical protein